MACKNGFQIYQKLKVKSRALAAIRFHEWIMQQQN